MPKKRTYNFKQLQGPTSPNASTRKDGGSSTLSVNEKLGELRKIEGDDAVQKKRQLAETVNQPSVPPLVRGLLGVPESAPPKPKHGARQRVGPRSTPGPAAPDSWTRGRRELTMTFRRRGGGKRPSHLPLISTRERKRPQVLLRFELMTGLVEDDTPERPFNLVDMALKTAALQWATLDEADYPALATIPLRLRLRLLAYIAHIGPALDIRAVEALTQGNEPVTYLDLAGLVENGALKLSRLSKLLRSSPEPASATSLMQSWDEDQPHETTLSPNPSLSRFSSITHLCLSHPVESSARWADLLSLSKHIPQVTHLSLAYWPWPTLTPNLATATMSNRQNVVVSAGGSNLYSAIDRDLSEPASLLRKLSASLLCLQWLDLEGCQDWFPAFSITASGEAVQRVQNEDRWSLPLNGASILVDTWKNLMYINCAQPLLPPAEGILALPRQNMPEAKRKILVELQRKLGLENSFQDMSKPSTYDNDKRKADMWLSSEELAVSAGRLVNSVRRLHGCKLVTFDYGWCQRCS